MILLQSLTEYSHPYEYRPVLTKCLLLTDTSSHLPSWLYQPQRTNNWWWLPRSVCWTFRNRRSPTRRRLQCIIGRILQQGSWYCQSNQYAFNNRAHFFHVLTSRDNNVTLRHRLGWAFDTKRRFSPIRLSPVTHLGEWTSFARPIMRLA